MRTRPGSPIRPSLGRPGRARGALGPVAPLPVAAAPPHGEQPRERTVGPLELFYDLAVVVLVAQAAHHLAGHLTWAGFGQFAAVFTLVWIAWANGSLHHELHGHEDARARSTFLLQILLLAAMGAFIPQADGPRALRSPSSPPCCSRCRRCSGCCPRAADPRRDPTRAPVRRAWRS
jgi:Bacterial low temperature requirement A protein (LtrA)